MKMTQYLRELIKYRAVLVTLVIRNMQARYKQTAASVTWAILQPVFMMVIFSIIFNRFAKFDSENIPYSIFCLTALIPWTFFTNAVNLAVPSLVENESLITKIYFPREVLPLAAIFTVMIDFFIAVLLYIFIVICMQIKITLLVFFVIPVFIMQLLFTVGLIFFASALNVFYRDIRFIVPFVIQIAMFATPIVYSANMISDKYKFVYMLNPMACFIDAYRKLILLGVMPSYRYLVISSVLSIVIFLFGYLYFKYVEYIFADVI